MHPGWVNTPDVAAALPGFYQAMQPILLTPEQGADTIAWLATMSPERLGSGQFWHDRRPRPEYPLPWMGQRGPGAARKLWDDLAAATAAGAPELAQAGLDSVAAEHHILGPGWTGLRRTHPGTSWRGRRGRRPRQQIVEAVAGPADEHVQVRAGGGDRLRRFPRPVSRFAPGR